MGTEINSRSQGTIELFFYLSIAEMKIEPIFALSLKIKIENPGV
jgi:hypothetical protein